MTKAKVVKLDNITVDDKIIALMGPTGTGKSTFIDTATWQKGKTVGHSLRSCTSEVRAVRFPHPTHLRPYVLVDTPGFNDTTRTDAEILSMIAEWLEKSYKKKVKISGIIYLHRISDNRMSGTPLKNLRTFAKLCGDGAIGNVVLATTMWTKVTQDTGEKRERELVNGYWSGMLSLGSQTTRFEDSFASAWSIIDKVAKADENDKNYPLLLQEELVELHRRLGETEAGKALYAKLREAFAEQKETMRKLYEEVEGTENEQLARELAKQYEGMQDELQGTFDQLSKLKIPLGRRLRMLFSFRKPRSHALNLREE